MPGRWQAGRLAGLMAALVMGSGLSGLAGPAAASAAAGCPAWDGTQPTVADHGPGTGSGFGAVAIAGPCDVWMGGDDATDQHGSRVTLIEHWTGGPSWTAVPSPSPGVFAAVEGMSAVSPADVWAVGVSAESTGRNSALVLHWDGTSWTQKAVPDSAISQNAVAAVSASDVWSGGASRDGGAFLMHYDGTNWTRSPLPALTPAPAPGENQSAVIDGLAAISAHDVWAVGLVATGTGDATAPLVLHWDGTSWTQKAAPAGNYALNAVSGSGPGDVWAVGATVTSGSASTVILHWNGTSWTQVPSPSPGSPNNNLLGVASISPTSALAVGNAGAGTPVALHWDGHSWTPMTTPSLGIGSSLAAVAAGPAGVWAGGQWEPSATSQIQAGVMMLGAAPSGVTVPNVVNDTDAAARTALTEAGLAVGTVTSVANCDVPRGIVVSQNPSAGATAALGAPVSLTESTGRATGGRPCP